VSFDLRKELKALAPRDKWRETEKLRQFVRNYAFLSNEPLFTLYGLDILIFRERGLAHTQLGPRYHKFDRNVCDYPDPKAVLIAKMEEMARHGF
jgi:hypothetical protein